MFESLQCCCPVGCCPEAPETLNWEITASCSAINGATGTATFIGGDGSSGDPYRWQDSTTVVGSCGTIDMFMICAAGVYYVAITMSSGNYDNGFQPTVECEPFSAEFEVFQQAEFNCCSGSPMSSFFITFTEP